VSDPAVGRRRDDRQNVEVVAFRHGDRLKDSWCPDGGRTPPGSGPSSWPSPSVAALPGLVPTTTVFHSVEDVPGTPNPGTVGLVTEAGPVFGDGARPRASSPPSPGRSAAAAPTPRERPSTPGDRRRIRLRPLPGLPHLGLGHRVAWVEAEPDGTVTRLVSRVGVDLPRIGHRCPALLLAA
jgi:hypothetical protein